MKEFKITVLGNPRNKNPKYDFTVKARTETSARNKAWRMIDSRSTILSVEQI